jgi:hypothetical protein
MSARILHPSFIWIVLKFFSLTRLKRVVDELLGDFKVVNSGYLLRGLNARIRYHGDGIRFEMNRDCCIPAEAGIQSLERLTRHMSNAGLLIDPVPTVRLVLTDQF